MKDKNKTIKIYFIHLIPQNLRPDKKADKIHPSNKSVQTSAIRVVRVLYGSFKIYLFAFTKAFQHKTGIDLKYFKVSPWQNKVSGYQTKVSPRQTKVSPGQTKVSQQPTKINPRQTKTTR